MKAYIVSYDLCGNGKDYSSLISNIKKFAKWAHITESTWFIKTNYSATDVRNYLNSCMDKDDRVFVSELGKTAAWKNTICDGNYLFNNY